MAFGGGPRIAYDQAGNRIQEVTTGAEASDKTFHYDAINRLERITDTTSGAELTRYAYDPNGNTTSKTTAGVTTNFFFDIRDQLGEVRQGSNILGRYGYDYDGRRILKIGDDGRRQYTYDQLSVVTEADQVNSTVSKYDYGMDQLVRLDNRNEGRSFFHLDFLGSTVGLTDAAGGSRQSIFYDAWGNERDRVGASANRFTFTGQEIDRETGLYYFKARFYDSETGRFLSQDDVLGEVSDPPDLHLYAYTQMNPLVFVDPTGNIEFIQEGLREGVKDVSELVKEFGISVAQNETIQKVPLLPRAIAGAGGTVSGVINFANSILGVANFAGNLAVGSLSFLSPESSIVQQSAKELTESFDEFSNTARVVKETGAGNVAMGIAKSGSDKFFQALKGDPRAIAETNAFAAEIATGIVATGGLGAASKGGTITQSTKEVAEEVLEQTARSIDDIGRAATKEAAEEIAERTARSLDDIGDAATQTARETTTAAAKKGPYRGGPHAETRGPAGDLLESHHMPPKSVSPVHPEKGPAIKMEPSHHAQTFSHGSQGAAGAAYRARIKGLLDEGKWRQALATEIRDVRRIAGSTYNEAIREMLAYAKTITDEAGRGLLRKK